MIPKIYRTPTVLNMMQIGKGKFARIKSGLPHFAEVEVEVSDLTERTIVETRCTGNGWVAQGSVEQATIAGYLDWKQGAVVGALYALTDLPTSATISIVITKIEGLITDTNPSIVAVASALAVWEAIGHVPSTSAIEKLEEIAFASWSLDSAYIPHAELGLPADST